MHNLLIKNLVVSPLLYELNFDALNLKFDAVSKSGVVEGLLSWADFKQRKDLKKADGTKRQRITGITKLEDAHNAGGKNSNKCTLILTERDSVKALAVSCLVI